MKAHDRMGLRAVSKFQTGLPYSKTQYPPLPAKSFTRAPTHRLTDSPTDPGRDQSPSSRGSSAATTPGKVAPYMIFRSREGSQPGRTPRDGDRGWHPSGEPGT